MRRFRRQCPPGLQKGAAAFDDVDYYLRRAAYRAAPRNFDSTAKLPDAMDDRTCNILCDPETSVAAFCWWPSVKKVKPKSSSLRAKAG